MIVKAIMVPHPPIAVHEVGKGEEKKIQSTLDGFHAVSREIAGAEPETVIVLSPHALMYRDFFNVSSGAEAYGDLGRFGAGAVAFEKEYDREFAYELSQLCLQDHFPAGTEYDRQPELDHGTMVPLYFLDQHMSDYKLVRIGLSGLSLRDHYRFGMYIAETAEKLSRRIAVIGSGDLAHCQKADGPYGYREEGPQYDEKIMKTMGEAEFMDLLQYDPVLLNRSMECGHRSFCIMAGILDGLAVKPHVYSHEATFGVGYGIVSYDILGKDASRHFLEQYDRKETERLALLRKNADPFVQLAWKSVESYVRTGKRMEMPEDLPSELTARRAGVFVSIHKGGDLRGCIGTIEPVYDSIAEEIIRNGVSACSRDPRFNPVEEEELPFLDISVDELSEPEMIADRSQLDPKRYGVICSCRGKRGVLLPDLDGVDSAEQQISIACSKGKIDPADDDLIIERFEAIRHV